jgi:hypothetical protein
LPNGHFVAHPWSNWSATGSTRSASLSALAGRIRCASYWHETQRLRIGTSSKAIV